MTLVSLRTFLMWCTIINGGFLLLAWLFTAIAQDWVYRMHRRFYPLTREQFNVAMYAFIGLLKLLWLVFNAVPFVALLLMA
ncbi:MAG: DUF6868 family protein [Phycisphaerae bacterium]